MKQTITETMFHDAFRDYGRTDNFSYEARCALFEYLEQLEEDTGEELELDVIALCCDYSEMTLEEINQDYSQEFEDMDEAIERLQDYTTVIPVDDDSVIVQGF